MPRIVYLYGPVNVIAGGIKAAFQHVELLADAGFDAVVATPDGTRPGWFASRAPLLTHAQLRVDDVLVLPENYQGALQAAVGWNNRKTVFCQNPSLVYQGLGPLAGYADVGVSHVLCPSHSVMHYCRRRFPGLALGYTPFFIDHDIFARPAQKKLQIVSVPRKRKTEFGAILDLFQADFPQYRQVEWLSLEQLSEAQVAGAMAESAVFLSLARLEAHGMTTLEAMASGCLVAGFTGVVGGSDSATARNGFWAAEDDVVRCVDQLARAVQLAIDQGPLYHAMIEAGRHTAWAYRREASGRRLQEFWRSVLG